MKAFGEPISGTSTRAGRSGRSERLEATVDWPAFDVMFEPPLQHEKRPEQLRVIVRAT